ncbi:hypothetical protein QBC45DRAFT_228056 [Copromyces sp. CBS 386.78]|nr:hypothetical protein QBC45DRAFT_228056 [Copromyces sp. CBS 386.78]
MGVVLCFLASSLILLLLPNNIVANSCAGIPSTRGREGSMPCPRVRLAKVDQPGTECQPCPASFHGGLPGITSPIREREGILPLETDTPSSAANRRLLWPCTPASAGRKEWVGRPSVQLFLLNWYFTLHVAALSLLLVSGAPVISNSWPFIGQEGGLYHIDGKSKEETPTQDSHLHHEQHPSHTIASS